jgi:hypothetical protein
VVLKDDVVLAEALSAEQLVHFVIDARRVHLTDAEETDLPEMGDASPSGESRGEGGRPRRRKER